MKTRKSYKYIVFGLLVIFLSINACQPEPEPPINIDEIVNVRLKLDWQHGSQFLGFYTALMQGYYAELGINVLIEPLTDSSLSSEIASDVESGKYDFGISAQSLLHAQVEGLELTAIANIYKLGPSVFFTKSDSGIVSIADFAGKSIVVKNEGWEENLVLLLANANLELSDVEIIEGGYDMSLFLNGEVEVWSGFLTDEVVKARLAGFELTTFPLYDYGVRSNAVTIYASHTLLRDNPNLAINFVSATIRGWQHAIDNPTESIVDMMELFPSLTETQEFYLASFLAAIPLMLPSGARLGEIDCEAWLGNIPLSSPYPVDKFCSTEIYSAAIATP